MALSWGLRWCLREETLCWVLFRVVFLIIVAVAASFRANAFTGTYGINYGRIADNIPSPDKVVELLRADKIKNVRIFDFDHSVLEAFSGTGLELVVGLPNGYLSNMSSSPANALDWVKQNIVAFLPATRIVGIAVGNEVLGGSDQELWGDLYGAVANIYNATKQLNIDGIVQISTSHSSAVFNNSYPPSSGTFSSDLMQYMKPLLKFFSQFGSPFCLNAYPFLAYMSDPDNIDINYALFQKTSGIYDNVTGLHYDNMLDAQIDAAYAALEDAGFGKMEVIITETGWASHGDQDEAAATLENARAYNYNLRKRLALRKGTPLRPKILLRVYVFALFNEDNKTGATSERNFGLFEPNGSIAYNIGFKGLQSSASAKGHGADGWVRRYSSSWLACTLALFLLFRP
ncbi:Glucan endo-1,3-beta-glucosidase 11-like protein [Drosera capensis]